MAYSDKQKKVTSWGVIILWMILFYPVGIYLLVRRLIRTGKVRLGNLLAGIGWFFVVFMILSLMLGLTGNMQHDDGRIYTMKEILGIDVAYLLIGLPLIYFGRKQQKKERIIKAYLPRIRNSRDGSLDDLAIACQDSYETVCQNIQMMIDKKVLADSYIDVQRRVLVSPLIGQLSEKRFTITCPYCGAIIEVGPSGGKCPYCDSYLHI